MVNQPVNIEELGFDTWQELYDWVAEQGLQEQAKITLTWPLPEPNPDVTVNLDAPIPTERPDVTLAVNTIRANAFKELYERLPTGETIRVFMEMLTGGSLTRTEADTIRTFLNNLPTKLSQ